MGPSIVQAGVGEPVPVAGVSILASPRAADLDIHLVLYLL